MATNLTDRSPVDRAFTDLRSRLTEDMRANLDRQVGEVFNRNALEGAFQRAHLGGEVDQALIEALDDFISLLSRWQRIADLARDEEWSEAVRQAEAAPPPSPGEGLTVEELITRARRVLTTTADEREREQEPWSEVLDRVRRQEAERRYGAATWRRVAMAKPK